MKRVILHVGTPKTGTTSLQHFFRDNVESLGEQGICWFSVAAGYPGIGAGRNAHFICCRAAEELAPQSDHAKHPDRTEANMGAFLSAVSDNDVVLMSDESLWTQAVVYPSSPALWKAIFEGAGVERVDIFVYLRPQASFIASLWNQRVKGRLLCAQSLDDYFDHAMSLGSMDYRTTLERISAVFGKDHVHVGVYERVKLLNGDVREDFCGRIGIEGAGGFVFRDSDSNPGLTENVAKIKQVANSVETYRAAGNYLQGPAVEISRSTVGERRLPRLSSRQLDAIADAYGQDNAWIAREYLGDSDGELFSDGGRPPRDPAPPSTDGEYLDDVVRFYVAALSAEREERRKETAALRRRVSQLEKQAIRKKSRGLLAIFKRLVAR